MFLAGSGPNNVSRRDGDHGLAEARDTKHGLGEAKHQATQQGKGWLKTSRNIDSRHHETLEMFPRIRELMKSSQPENKTLLRVSRLHSGTL